METNSPQNQASSVPMQITDDVLNALNVDSHELSKEAEEALKQTAMRTIIYQISTNYREELENLLGKDNLDENGQPIALREDTIPKELYEFICKNIISIIPDIEIEIIEESEQTTEVSDEAEGELDSNDSQNSFEED
jgi:predicted HAD superfamily phosphohydrolase